MNEVTELRNRCQKGMRAVGGEERRGEMREQERRGDSHRKPQPWSAGTACAGPHPRKEGNPPAGCRGSPLRHTQKHIGTHTHTHRENAQFVTKNVLQCVCFFVYYHLGNVMCVLSVQMSVRLSVQLTAGPDVHRFAICLLPQYLRGQVPRCASKSCSKHTHTDTQIHRHTIDWHAQGNRLWSAILGSACIESQIIFRKLRPVHPHSGLRSWRRIWGFKVSWFWRTGKSLVEESHRRPPLMGTDVCSRAPGEMWRLSISPHSLCFFSLQFPRTNNDLVLWTFMIRVRCHWLKKITLIVMMSLGEEDREH